MAIRVLLLCTRHVQTQKIYQRFKKLFKTLKQHNASEIEKLCNWIKYLKEKNYQADISVLEAM